MRNIIVGTAGHIDHGKTALVGALTGIDTDRLDEEKRRGISIELGFAHLDLDADARVAFVDVPGHERFIKNMLAGATGIDLVLLVISSAESIKPQTAEHFQICRLLGISRGIVALTKSDLVTAAGLERVRHEVKTFLAGSFLEGAPVLPVSAVTGAGLDELRAALRREAALVQEKDATQAFRVPIDRVFSMRGFGTVVTGTLAGGSVGTGAEVEVQPTGARLRVRGVQVHGEPVPRAFAGQRTALNLAGADPDSLRRGMTLIECGRMTATTVADCACELLAASEPLRHRATVHFHAWTAETPAEVRLLDDSGTLVRFLLRDPILLVPGDRFIIRQASPLSTIGGGRVLDIAPPPRLRRAAAAERLRAFEADPIATLLREAPYGITRSALDARGIRVPAGWPETGRVHDSGRRNACAALLARRLAEFHAAEPLLAGMPKAELRAGVFPEAPPDFLDALIAQSPEFAIENDLVRLRAHEVRVADRQQEALDHLEGQFQAAGFAPPDLKIMLAEQGALVRLLIQRGALQRIAEGLLLHRTAVEALHQILRDHRGERFTVAAFKEWTGVSRRHAIPLLEYLDRHRFTRREGDMRVVL